MVNNFEDFEASDEGSYDKGVPGLKEIVLRHIGKISELSCSEFMKGYWQDKPIKVAGGVSVVSSYHEDTRAVYCNAIDFLIALVSPDADEQFKNKVKDLTDEGEWDTKLKQRIMIFKEMNLMFKRTGYFDNQTGKTEWS